jgi:hypothetical protein
MVGIGIIVASLIVYNGLSDINNTLKKIQNNK